MKICKGMKNISKLEALNISHNIIYDEAASSVATVLSHNRNLQTLNLSNSFRSEGCITIFNDMKNISYLRFLNISYNKITIETTDSIATVLSQNTNLEELDISYNELHTPGAIKIFQSIKHTSNLMKLNITHNMITNEATEHIIYLLCNNNKLKELNLSHNNTLETDLITKLIAAKATEFNDVINEKAVNRISIIITNLRELDLSNINLQTSGVFKIFKGLESISTLTKLNFSGNSITPFAATVLGEFLSKNSELQELDLSHNDLQESGIKKILGTINISNLTKLNISDNNVNLYAIVEVLSNAIKLEELDLSCNKLINAVDAAYFFSRSKNIFVNLIKLNMSAICHEINNEAAATLAHVFSQTTILKELDLSSNNLNSEVICKIFSEINTSTLIKFSISHNSITGQAVDYIATFLSRNRNVEELDISYNNLLSDGVVKICKINLSKLKSFNVSQNGCTNTAANDLADFLSYNSQLQVLKLNCSDLEESGCSNIFRTLKEMSVISSLNISNCNVINKAVDELANVLLHTTLLQALDISCNRLSSSDTVKIFKGMKNISSLRTVNISHNLITDAAAENIANVLFHNNKLNSLDLSSNYFKCKGFVKIFEKMNNILYLKKLNISCNEITNIDAAHSIANVLSHNSKLEDVDLSNNFMQTANTTLILKSLRHTSSLKKLNLYGNMITDEAADHIADILSHQPKLLNLDISCHDLQTMDLFKIFQGIKHITTLSKLNIAHSMISYEAAKYIVDGLSNCSNLKELNLSYNGMESVVLFRNVEATNLTKFTFSHSDINTEMAHQLLQFLTQCSYLQVLDLSYTNLQTAKGINVLNLIMFTIKIFSICGNLISVFAAEYIAEFLSYNDKLEELDLSCNNLEESGIIKILRSICLSKLIKLNISNNNITTDIENMVSILTRATKLVELDLSHNKFTVDPTKFLSQTSNVMFVNLIKLNVAGNKASNGNVAIALTNVLADNTKLKELNLSDNKLRAEEIVKIFNGLKITTLTKLNVSYNNINDEAAENVANFLSKNQGMEELDLSHTDLLDAGAIKICRTKLTKLTKFNIGHNNITVETAHDISTFLSHNTKLKVLDLRCNDLQESGCGIIVNVLQDTYILSSLKISKSNIINKLVDELAAVLHNNISLQELDLSYNNLSTSDAVKIFKGMKNISYLETINISYNMISDEAAENIATVLSHNIKLKSLDCSSNHFTSESFVKIFDGMKNIMYLKKLNIGCNEITHFKAIDCIADFLFRNSKLEELDLSNNFIQASGIITVFKRMGKITNLRKLFIHGNIITNKAAHYIAVIFSQNSKLEEIDISRNNLKTTGAKEIFKGIRHILTLTKLNIAHNLICNKAAGYIKDILNNNNKLKQLNLSYNNLAISNLTECNFTHLQTLNLSYTDVQTAVSIEGLTIFTLKKLDISGNCINESAVNGIAAFLSENDELQELDLSCNNLQGLGTRNILDFLNISCLTKLNISNINITSDIHYIADILTHATELMHLDLSYNKLSSDDIKNFLYKTNNVFTNLMYLNLSGNEICDEAATALAFVLAENTKLKELNICDANLHREEIIKIFTKLRFPYLTKLSISHNDITNEAADDIANFLSKSYELKELDLSHNNIKSAGAIKICRANLLNLTTFNISQNSITTGAANDIANFLSHNLRLKVLDLSYNDLQESGCKNIFKALQNISVLTALKLSNCNVVNKAADELAVTLLCNIYLQEVDLSYNNLSSSDITKILKGMKNLTDLISFNISHNKVTDEAGKNIANILSRNCQLQVLNMSFICLSYYEYAKIFKGMKNIIYLRTLDISCNNISFQASRSIAAVLAQNRKLEELDISYNDLQTRGAIKIFQGIKKYNSALRKLNIAHNMVTDEATHYIIDVLCSNSRLKKLNLSHNKMVESGVIAKMLVKNTTVTYNKQAVTRLSILTNLQELDVHNVNLKTAVDMEFFKVLDNISTLKKLNVSKTSLTPFAKNDLAEFLSKNCDLHELDLSHNDLQEIGIVTILRAIKCSNLTKLNISANNVNLRYTIEFFSHASMLNLTELNLSCNKLNSAEDAVLFFTCTKNIFANLIKLDMSETFYEINDKAANALAQVFTQNIQLKELILSNNNLNSEVVSKVLDE